METQKVAITLNRKTLLRLDRMVKGSIFPNRSRAIQEAVEEKLNRLEKTRLAKECAKADIGAERAMAEEGFSEDMSRWPEY
jgi:metal-responsive CopG/Arc/MetJ family transcriptional regulator